MAGKISKADAGYGPGMPHCGACRHYGEDEETEEGSCDLVAGDIDEDAWCKLFEEEGSRTMAGGTARGR